MKRRKPGKSGREARGKRAERPEKKIVIDAVGQLIVREMEDFLKRKGWFVPPLAIEGKLNEYLAYNTFLVFDSARKRYREWRKNYSDYAVEAKATRHEMSLALQEARALCSAYAVAATLRDVVKTREERKVLTEEEFGSLVEVRHLLFGYVLAGSKTERHKIRDKLLEKFEGIPKASANRDYLASFNIFLVEKIFSALKRAR